MTTTVQEAYDNLGRLIAAGHKDRPLFAISGSSGVSYDVSLYSEVRVNDCAADIDGPLCEEEAALIFVPVYLG